MPSTDIDGTPILVLRHEEIVELAWMIRWIRGEWSPGQEAVILRMDKFLAETGGGRVDLPDKDSCDFDKG